MQTEPESFLDTIKRLLADVPDTLAEADRRGYFDGSKSAGESVEANAEAGQESHLRLVVDNTV